MHNENEHIDDSKLRAIATEGGMITPEHYFEHMRKQVLQRTTGLEQDDTFTIPEGYFEKSRAAILSQTTEKPQTMRLWYTKSIVKYAAAAVIVITATVTFLLTKQQNQTGLQSMTSDEIILYFEEEGVREIPVTEVAFAVTENPVNPEEKYIINNTDEQSIIEEL